MPDDEFELTPADLEMLREQQSGKILPRPAAVGVADMAARIKQLTAAKKQILDRLQAAETLPDDAEWDRVAELNRQIKTAEERLAEYRLQQDNLN